TGGWREKILALTLKRQTLYVSGHEVLERRFQRRELFQRQTQGDEIARIAGTGTDAANGALEVAHVRQLLAEAVETEGIFNERLHGVLPAANWFDSGERLRKPLAQQPRAHWCDGAVERAV